MKTITWDLEDAPIKFPKEVRHIFDKAFIYNRKNFTLWIDKISKKNQNDIDWWSTLPSLRDPYTNNLLNYISVIDTISKIKFKNLKIITRSYEMKRILERNFKNKKLNIKATNKKEKLNVISNFLKSIVFQIIIYFYINIFFKKKKIEKSQKITLVDTFITLNRKQNLGYYPKDIKNFIGKSNLKILIVPTFVPTLNIFKLFKIINNLPEKKDNYLFKEHYIQISDLFFSFFHIFRRNKFLKEKFNYKKIDLSELIYKEIKNYGDFNSIIIGILNYKFFKRLYENDINIFKSINWFENQIVDKGWNLGFRYFFQKFEHNSFGYQDFNKHFNLINHSPSENENKSRVTPNNVIVISKSFIKVTKEFYRKQKITVGESWRFKKILNLKIKTLNKRNKILFILCGVKQIDEQLLKMAIEICLKNTKIKIYIKDHPILDLKKITSLPVLPKNLIVLYGDLQKILNQCFVSITSGPSSAILESACMNTLLILPEIEPGVKENIKILNLNRNNVFIVKSASEILKKVIFIKKNLKKFKFKKIDFLNSKSKKLIQIISN